MRRKIMAQKLFATLGAWLLIAPLSLLLGWGVGGLGWQESLPLLLSALLLACLVRALPKRARLIALIAALAGSFGLPLVYAWPGGLALSLLHTVALLCHLQALSRPTGNSDYVGIWYIGIALYLLCRMATLSLTLRPMQGALRGCAGAYFAYILFALNEQTLLDGMGGGRAPSRQMRLRNRMVIAAMSALLLILTNLPALRRALQTALSALKRALFWLLGWLAQLFAAQTVEQGAQAPMEQGIFAAEAATPSALLLFLEKLMQVIGLLGAAALAGLALWKGFHALKKLWRYVLSRLLAYAEQVSEAYEDTVESLVDWGEVKQALAQRKERLRARREERIPWEKRSPRERVRYAYRQYLSMHPEITPSLTVRRALRERSEAAQIYERARYSGGEITAQEAERVGNDLQIRKGKRQ